MKTLPLQMEFELYISIPVMVFNKYLSILTSWSLDKFHFHAKTQLRSFHLPVQSAG